MVAELRVTSHVGRDLLAAASLFKKEDVAVWEYVVNGIQYVDRGIAPVINVTVHKNSITIADNGRGMNAEDLEHYFRMHGENRDRRAGVPGRGKFGTGKSAAFGIAKGLRVQTVRDGLHNEVLLTREDIDRSNGEAIALNWVVSNQPTEAPTGTTVTIEDVILERIDTASIKEYIERHLGAFRGQNPQVLVNTHVCEYQEPEVADTRTFRPSEKQAGIIGDVNLTIKVARAPLDTSQQGITVTAGASNVVGIERAGLERKEFSNYLFGEVDVPKLEEPYPIAPYDATRNLQLNPNNPVVKVLVGFIGAKMEEVRADLVKKESERRSSAQAKALEKESTKIADILNRDFTEQQRRLRTIQTATARPERGPARAQGSSGAGGEGEDRFAAGIDQPGTRSSGERKNTEKDKEKKHGQTDGGNLGMGGSAGTPNPDGTDPLSATKKAGKAKPAATQGGFSVLYRPLGTNEARSRYDSDSMAILINIDHPVLSTALEKGGVNDIAFRRLSYEIAFSEYAIALGYESAREDPDMAADDLLYEVRSTLNRIARAAADLYR